MQLLKTAHGWGRRLGLTSNLGLKAGAVLLAFALVLYVASERKDVIEIPNVPLQLENIPSGFTVTGDVPETLAVRIRGSHSTLTRISTTEVSARVDLTRVKQGEQIWPLTAHDIRAPFGVDVERITPSQLILRLEEKVTVRVRIEANLTGKVPEGYRVTETTVEPPEARVRSAGSIVEEVASVTTQPVLLSGRKNSFTTQVRVHSPRSDVELVGPEQATVRVGIEEVRSQRTLTVPVEMVGQARGRIQINPRSLSITLDGPASRVETVQAADLRVTLQVGGLEPRGADYRIEPEVVLRRPDAFPGVTVTGLGQSRVDVHVYAVQEPTD